MSNTALTHVWKHSKVKGAALILMLAIADMANDDGECWPGKANLATKCRVSKRHLQRIIQECERAGELLVIENKNAETQRWGSNHYIVVGVGKEREDARPIRTAPKKRQFPRQIVTLLPSDTGVSTPDDTNVITPSDTGVSQTLIETQRDNPQLTVSSDTDVRPIRTAPKKRVTKSDTVPREKMNPMLDALVLAFGYEETVWKTPKAGELRTAAKSLCLAEYTPEQVPTVYTYCQKHFTHFGPNAIAKHAPDALKAAPSTNGNGLHLTPAGKPRAEQDANESHLRKLREQQERMEARYGDSD